MKKIVLAILMIVAMSVKPAMALEEATAMRILSLFGSLNSITFANSHTFGSYATYDFPYLPVLMRLGVSCAANKVCSQVNRQPEVSQNDGAVRLASSWLANCLALIYFGQNVQRGDYFQALTAQVIPWVVQYMLSGNPSLL